MAVVDDGGFTHLIVVTNSYISDMPTLAGAAVQKSTSDMQESPCRRRRRV
ncbi:hypothetical protein LINGRAHAP2_LOCUS16617 [Linum grandiflorum]